MSTTTEAPAAAAPPTLDPNALKRAAEEPGRNPGPWRHPGSHVPRFTSRTSRPAKQDGVGLKYGEYWVQGKRPSMEDAHSAALDAAKLLPASEPAKQDPDHHFAFFGIFDGHGGPRAAEFTAANLLPFMQEEKLKQTDMRTALERALHRVEEEWLKLARKADETDGTCVAVAVIDGKRLIAASIGDSEMVLSRNGRAFALCEVHNPSRNGDEAKRIEEAGGLLDKKRMRVIDPQNMHSLALSRTVGDLTYKTQETGVIAEPDIQEYELGESDTFLVIGCDGVWDVVEHQEAVDFCANLLRSGVRPPEVAKQLVEYAFAQGSTDNISACVVVLDHGAEPKDVAGAETA